MSVNQEGVFTIYGDNGLVAIIKRDEESKKHLVYITTEATSGDIAELFKKYGKE